MERVGRITAVGAGIGQGTDDLQELDHRAGPAVGDDQRERVGLGRAGVDEVHARPVDLGEEVVEGVEHRLGAAPVVLVAPVRDELGEVPALGAVVPARVGELLREPGARRAAHAGRRGRRRGSRS